MLTDVQCRNAECPAGKKIATFRDGQGLYLEVAANGRKRWFQSLWIDGKGTRIALGGYPTISLKEARAKAAELKAKKARGVNPVQERREAKLQQRVRGATWRQVAEEWLNRKTWKGGDKAKAKIRGRLERHLLPALGGRVMEETEPLEVLDTLKKILDDSKKERRETAKKVGGYARQIWNEAIATGRVKKGDIVSPVLRLLPKPEVTHYAAVTKPQDLARVVQAIRVRGKGAPWVWTALQLMPMLFLRQVNIRGMRWERIDWEAATLTIPRAEMKTQQTEADFVTPLPRQALALLKALRPMTDTPSMGGWCFPNQQRPRQAPISEAALPGALKSRGISSDEQMMHGFRATACTILREVGGFPKDEIETQLDHAVTDTNGRAYNRTDFLEQRREMLQIWADYLDALADGVEPQRAAKIVKVGGAGK